MDWFRKEAATEEEGGKIASQMPAPVAELEKGLTIRLDVYPALRGNQVLLKVKVPILVGLPVQRAENELRRLGLAFRRAASRQCRTTPSVQENTVATQSIAPGTPSPSSARL